MRSPTVLLVFALTVATALDLDAQDFLERNVPAQPAFVPGQVIVKMRANVSLTAARLTALGLDSAYQQTSAGEYVYQIPAPVVGAMVAAQARDRTMAVVDSLSAEESVEYAQPNYRLYIVASPAPAGRAAAVVPSDTRWAEQWHYHNNGNGPGQSPGGIGLPDAWETTTGSSSVVVSILDTGILPNHPDIVGSPNLIAGFDMISDPFTAADGDGRDNDPTDPGDGVLAGQCDPGPPPEPPVNLDDSWHGTHVAGTVGVGNTDNAQGVAGVNWNVSVQAVRVLGRCGGSTADINDGIRWAAGLSVPGVPNNSTPAKVISMSLGTPPGVPCSLSPSTQSAINDAVAAGATVVVAAGNDGVDASSVFPASCENVITVAASEGRGRLATRYSNFGETVEIMAPGGDRNRDDNSDGNPDGVLSMIRGGYAYYNGTSMATPHVSGVAALWLAHDPTLTPATLLSQLQARALPRSTTECPDPCGAGLLSAILEDRLTISLALDDAKIGNDETTTATATVRFGIAPRPGETVTFLTDDPSIATIDPPTTAMSDANGVATATVRGVSTGDANVTARLNGESASQPIRVPSLSFWALVVLVLAMIAVLFRREHTALGRR
jgi:serine protease